MKRHRRAMHSLTGAVQLVWSFIFPPAPAPVRPRKDAKGPLTTDEALTRQAADLLRGIGCAALAGRVSVRWHARLVSTAGLARPENAEVHLNPRLKEFPGEVDRTLRHELAHLAAYDRAGKRRITAHGAEWRLACLELGLPDENRCHTLPLGRRRPVRRGHVYRCPRCATTLRRTRPINARRHRLACRDCCRQFAGGRFDGRFEFVKADGEGGSGQPSVQGAPTAGRSGNW